MAPQRTGLPGLNGGGAAAAVPPLVDKVQGMFSPYSWVQWSSCCWLTPQPLSVDRNMPPWSMASNRSTRYHNTQLSFVLSPISKQRVYTPIPLSHS